MSPHDDDARFTELFHRWAPRVYAYARRHSDALLADDVVAETFLVAWRRRRDVPAEPLPWLLVVARNMLANQRRTNTRRSQLITDLSGIERLAAAEPAAESTAVGRAEMLAALAALTGLEREAVLLVAWDGLATEDAARVAGCSTRAFKVRLHRARRRLDREFATPVPTVLENS